MKLSYRDIFSEGGERIFIEAEISMEHSASSYGLPVIMLEDGGALDLMSWVAMDYKIEDGAEDELEAVQHILNPEP